MAGASVSKPETGPREKSRRSPLTGTGGFGDRGGRGAPRGGRGAPRGRGGARGGRGGAGAKGGAKTIIVRNAPHPTPASSHPSVNHSLSGTSSPSWRLRRPRKRRLSPYQEPYPRRVRLRRKAHLRRILRTTYPPDKRRKR